MTLSKTLLSSSSKPWFWEQSPSETTAMDLNQPPPCDQTLSLIQTRIQITMYPSYIVTNPGWPAEWTATGQALESRRGPWNSDGHTGCFLSPAFLWDASPQAKPRVRLFLQLSLWSTKVTTSGGKIKPLTLNELACGESHFQKHR